MEQYWSHICNHCLQGASLFILSCLQSLSQSAKASFTLSRSTPRCVPAGCSGPRRTETNRDGIRVRSYIPGSATDQTRFGEKSEHGVSRLCYGLRRCIPGVSPAALRCVPVRRVTEVGRQSPGVTR